LGSKYEELNVSKASLPVPQWPDPFWQVRENFADGPTHEVAARQPAARGARAEIAVCVAARG